MISRVTENIKFNMLTNSMSTVQGEYGKLMEKLSTQKMINRPSDDPIGTNDILDHRTAINSINQFKANIADANIWLNLTETDLSGLRAVVDQAKSIAITESGAGASSETRQSDLSTLTSLIDEALTLLNDKNGDNYMFGGSSTDVKPFTSTYEAASVGAASVASTNRFDGTVTSSGVYTGTENKTYVFKITGGTVDAADYAVSSNGGNTWTTTGILDLSAPATISLGDGMSLNFTATSVIGVNDTFIVNGNAAGYYRGNNDKLNAVIGKDNKMAYNITGAEAFTGPIASAAVAGSGSGLTVDDTIVLTRGATPTSWTVTSNSNYPDMVITSQAANALTIDANNDGTGDVTLNLSGNWNDRKTATFSIKAGVPPTLSPVNISGPGSVDLLTTLNALKSALAEPDQAQAEKLIAAQIENLTNASTQILQYETQAGAKMQSMELTDSNHDTVKLQITNMLSDIENADMTQLIEEFQMKQIAMQASYEMASKIGKMTIMDYII
jgi:flagellar hook-associated protein 3 FlgL